MTSVHTATGRWAGAAAVTVALLLVAGCGPGGPGGSELRATSVFATVMPEAVEIGTGSSDPRGTIEGSEYGRAWRMFGTDADEDSVLAWYRAAYEADGWEPDRYAFGTMTDGYGTEPGWQKGDLRIAIGFIHRDWLVHSSPSWEPKLAGHETIYETIIFYRPATASPSA